jgi:SNF2 family DNA or RNA helicase
MMALRLDPVRLLIADDVGVGKTIEAGLIARELWERGEVRRIAVLCPPYLCDQWQKEHGKAPRVGRLQMKWLD